MAHAQKPDFVFRRNGRVHLNRQGRQFSLLQGDTKKRELLKNPTKIEIQEKKLTEIEPLQLAF